MGRSKRGAVVRGGAKGAVTGLELDPNGRGYGRQTRGAAPEGAVESCGDERHGQQTHLARELSQPRLAEVAADVRVRGHGALVG